MKLVVKDPASLVLVGDRDTVRAWRESQKVPVPGAEYTNAYQRGWDGMYRPGTIRYYGDTAKLFMDRGLMSQVLDSATVEVERECQPPIDLPLQRLDGYLEDLPELRDYQHKALRLIDEHKWGRIGYATNAGKGAIIALTGALAVESGMQVAVFSDEVSVFQALEEEIEKWAGVSPELVEAGRDDAPVDADFVLAMIPTLYNRTDREEWQEWLSQVDVALLDEADRATADRWQEVLSHMNNTHYRVGFSGSFDTHDPDDELKQKELMGPILQWVKNKELVDRGISAKPQVVLHKFVQELPDLDWDWWFDLSGPERRRWAYEQGVVFNPERNRFVKTLIDEDVSNAVIVRRVDHGEVLEDVLDDARFLYGEDSKQKRLETLEAFQNKEFRTLIATSILDRGTNLLGHAVGLIFASGAGSETQVLQRMGRGLRKTEEKEFLFLRDVLDVPPPYAEDMKVNPYKYFRRAGRKRITVYNEEGFEVRIDDD